VKPAHRINREEAQRDSQDRISELDDAVAETAMKTFAAEAHGTDGKAPTAGDVREASTGASTLPSHVSVSALQLGR